MGIVQFTHELTYNNEQFKTDNKANYDRQSAYTVQLYKAI